MSKVIIFSREFPSYHPMKGKPTYFVEQFLKQQKVNYLCNNYLDLLCKFNTKNIAEGKLSFKNMENFYLSLREKEDEKNQTIREGERFISGEIFSPRCWFGKPYRSPQIIFWEDTLIKFAWRITIEKHIEWYGDNRIFIGVMPTGHCLSDEEINKLAINDGFKNIENFFDWFPDCFYGQILSWKEKAINNNSSKSVCDHIRESDGLICTGGWCSKCNEIVN